MKNAVIFGLIIGILSGIWIFVMYKLNYTTFQATSPIEYASALIPVLGLYFGVKRYRDVDKAGNIS
jgi:fatty-acid desaturase